MATLTHCPPAIYYPNSNIVLVPEWSSDVAEYSKKTDKELKTLGVKFSWIKVLSKNLKGRTDLYGKPYKPANYRYIEPKK